MLYDPIVDEVRRVKEELAAKFNYDVAAIFEDIESRQALLGDRLVYPKSQRAELAPVLDNDALPSSAPARG